MSPQRVNSRNGHRPREWDITSSVRVTSRVRAADHTGSEGPPNRGQGARVVRGGDNAFMLLSSGEVQLALVTEQEIRLLREFGTRKLLLSPG